jgi:hypothetical protein
MGRATAPPTDCPGALSALAGLLRNVRVPEPHSVIVVLPQGPEKTQVSLLAIAKSYQARGRAVWLFEASQGVERYYKVRQRLAGGRR